MERLRRVLRTHWEPTREDWWQAGLLVRRVGDRQGWEVSKRRAFQNDALIGLTARRHGATVVTANTYDYQLLAVEIGIHVRPPP